VAAHDPIMQLLLLISSKTVMLLVTETFLNVKFRLLLKFLKVFLSKKNF